LARLRDPAVFPLPQAVRAATLAGFIDRTKDFAMSRPSVVRRRALAVSILFALLLPVSAFAQTDKPDGAGDPALTCAMLFNWVARTADGLPADRQDRLETLLTQIADMRNFSPPSQTDCASVLQILVQEGFDISDMGLREVAGVAPHCASVLPFTQQRYLALDHVQRGNLLVMMDGINLPIYGRSDDLVACALLHGVLDQQNLFEVMQEF
jgi:hypothetical protein